MGSADVQCRWLGFAAHPPHEQGTGVLRFVSDGAGEGVDGGRPARAAVPPASAFGSVFTRPSPTSRGLGRCVSFRMGRGREQTAAGPRAGACRLRGVGRRCLALWARGAAGMRGRRCLPCGQRRCRVARWIMACRGRERGFRSGLPIREIYRRAGERGNGPHPAGDGDTRHLADRTRPSPGKTFRIILPPQTRRSTRHASLPVAENLPGTRPRPAFRACLRPIHTCLQPIRAIYGFLAPVCGHSAPFTAIPRPQKSASHPSRYRLISQTIPQGERRALPVPAQGTYPLGIPFWKPPLSLPSLRPQKRRRRQAPTRGLAAV